MQLNEIKLYELMQDGTILYLNIKGKLLVIDFNNKISFINIVNNSIIKEVLLDCSANSSYSKMNGNILLLLNDDIAMINTSTPSIEYLLGESFDCVLCMNKNFFVTYKYISDEIKIYNLETKEVYKKFPANYKGISINSAFISNDNKTLLTASMHSNEVIEWYIENVNVNHTFTEEIPAISIKDLFLTPDNKYLVCGLNDDMVNGMTEKDYIPFCSIWDFESKKHLYNLGDKLKINYDFLYPFEHVIYKLDYLYGGKLTVAYTTDKIIIFETSDCKVYKIIDVRDGLFAVDKQENCIAYKVNLDEKGEYLGYKVIISKIELIED